MQTNVDLNNVFTDASYERTKGTVFSSLRADAESFANEVATAPDSGPVPGSISCDIMMHEAWERSRQVAKEQGRMPTRAEVQATLYNVRDETKSGFTI